jgi:Glyoxalase/Bleomycin resistance protein/Dioxygenase superfamily
VKAAAGQTGGVPSLRPIVKIAYAVDDARGAALRWATQVGAGPFFIKPHIPIRSFGDGDFGFDHTSAFGQCGGLMIELIEFHRIRPAAAAEILLNPGLHHVTWIADSLEDESRRLELLGWREIFTATTAGGTTFRFHDSRRDLGHLVEIYERSPAVAANYNAVAKAAAGWDGTDPVRE